ncbi:hypothetical protein HYR54_10930 [Candidatus Acetothermia bacterium]|nr:hypothetical protein [Candidatus Acetothermia bacterium]MBI3460104.1 hypothetical protein [Candidatus Acetothermia bacterium]MBI3659411.1 hypothetical protein [Candidatus Acetothermia bacterium]
MIATNTILTSLICARCSAVGRLIRKEAKESSKKLEGAEYFYTLRCPNCGEIDLYGVGKGLSKPATSQN